jgi:drug/metabolite transporter (DMT)-like permease
VKARDLTQLLLLALIWGSAFLFNDVVVEDVPPLTIVAGRLIISALLLAAIAVATGRRAPPREAWGVLLFLAIANNVGPFALITWAQGHITSSLAATLNATMPMFTVLVVFVIGVERPDAWRSAGVVIGFVGAVVLIGTSIEDFTSSNTLGQFAVIVASAGYAVSTVVARQRLSGDAVSLATGQMVFGALVAAPLALVVDGRPSLDVPWDAAASWLALGVLSSGLAYIIFFSLVQRVTATQVSIVAYLIPVTATVLGWAVLDEEVGANLFVGMGLIFAGMLFVNGNAAALWSRLRGERSPAGAAAPGP